MRFATKKPEMSTVLKRFRICVLWYTTVSAGCIDKRLVCFISDLVWSPKLPASSAGGTGGTAGGTAAGTGGTAGGTGGTAGGTVGTAAGGTVGTGGTGTANGTAYYLFVIYKDGSMLVWRVSWSLEER